MAFARYDIQAEDYVPPRMTDAQMQELEHLIARSPEATIFAKKVIVWALRQTQNLTRRVMLAIPDAEYGYGAGEEVQDSAHHMLRESAVTPLRRFMRHYLGTEVSLSHTGSLYGEATVSEKGSTLWVSHVLYDYKAEKLTLPSPGEIGAVVLPT